MRVREFLAQVRNTLNDKSKTFWDDSELLDYYNECMLAMAAERLEGRTVASITLDPEKFIYDTTGIIRYISATDDEDNERKLYPDDGTGDNDSSGVIIEEYNRIKVNDPSIGSFITFKCIAQPDEQNFDSTLRYGDEQAIKYYILSKCYEQDLDVQDLQKSSYFYAKFRELMVELIGKASVGYRANTVSTTKSYWM